jgi:hypothetical protein
MLNDRSLEQLRREFNSAAGGERIILHLSPT